MHCRINEEKEERNKIKIKEYLYKRKERIRQIDISDKINLVMTFLTLISVIGVFVTLREMKIQRNMAYAPSIVMNPVDVEFEWDEFGNEKWLLIENDVSENKMDIDENGNVTGEIAIPISGLEKTYTEYTVTNIGVGTARNITFEWFASNTENLYNYLKECNSEGVEEWVIGSERDALSINNQKIIIDKEKTMSLMYMLPEAQETYTLQFPIQYTLLIHEIIKNGNFKNLENPHVALHIKYQDIQGNVKHDVIIIVANITLIEKKLDGSGRAIYQLVPAFESK